MGRPAPSAPACPAAAMPRWVWPDRPAPSWVQQTRPDGSLFFAYWLAGSPYAFLTTSVPSLGWMLPYRVPPNASPQAIGDDASGDADLLPVFAIVWAGSVVRVWIAISGREDFGTEATAALLFALGSPFLFKDWFAGLWRRPKTSAIRGGNTQPLRNSKDRGRRAVRPADRTTRSGA